MKRGLYFIGYWFLIIGLAGCSLVRRTASVDIMTGVASLAPYSGPKACITIPDFNVKAAKATGEIGSGVREMLIAALTKSNRFSIVERQQAQAAIKQEPPSGTSGAAGVSNNGQQRGAVKNADLIITASIAEFQPQASGGRAGMGGGGGAGSGLLGGLLGSSLNKAHMVLDLSIADTSSSKALGARRIQGEASDIAWAVKSGFSGSGGLGPGLSVYTNTPMEKAIRICIIEAVRYMSEAIPESYYKYQDGKT